MKNYVLLLMVIIISIGTYLAFLVKQEGFQLNKLNRLNGVNVNEGGSYPKTVKQTILDDYPLIGTNQTSNNTYNSLLGRYPVFQLGSYEQITNNLKHWHNPDNGSCVHAEFCGAIYHDKQNTPSNIITPLPPAQESSGARVGYFRTEPNELYYSIPTNENILY